MGLADVTGDGEPSELSTSESCRVQLPVGEHWRWRKSTPVTFLSANGAISPRPDMPSRAVDVSCSLLHGTGNRITCGRAFVALQRAMARSPVRGVVLLTARARQGAAVLVTAQR